MLRLKRNGETICSASGTVEPRMPTLVATVGPDQHDVDPSKRRWQQCEIELELT